MSSTTAPTEGTEEPPRLSEAGARRLAEALEHHDRHDTARARAGAHRRKADPLRSDPSVASVDVSSPDASPRSSETSNDGADLRPILLIAGAVGFVALMIAGAITVLFGDDAVSTEVAGEVEVADAGDAGDVGDEASTASLDVVTTVEATESSVARTASEAVADEPSAPAAPSLEPGDLELTIYDVDPLQSGVRSFAIRVRNVAGPAVIDTELIEVALEDASGERIPAFVRFQHGEVPLESSAIATVRVENLASGEMDVIVRYEGNDVASEALPNPS